MSYLNCWPKHDANCRTITIPACLIKIACKKHLSAPKAQSLRAGLTKCIRKAKRPASNIRKGEFKALQELKADIDITILPADKGRSTVILNTKDYESKLSTLLSDSKTYEMQQNDPTPKFKRTDRNDSTMSKGGPNHYSAQTCYLFQKKSQRCMAYLGSTGECPSTNNCRKPRKPHSVLADMFCPLVGKSEHHIQNSGDFVDKVKNLEVPPGQKLIAYDVSALFTSIPLPDAIKAVRIKLSIIASLYMEGFEEIALRTASNPTLQCGSGTCTIHLP